MPSTCSSLAQLLRRHAEDAQHSGCIAFRFLADGEGAGTALDYAGLDREVARVAAGLRCVTARGDRVLLLLPPSLDYIVAFLACLHAGLVAVPAYPPGNRRTLPRLRAIFDDCRPAACIVLDDEVRERCVREFGTAAASVAWIDPHTLPAPADDAGCEPYPVVESTPAVLQYTSGSTSAPKGVIVTHGNLMANCAAAVARYGMTRDDVVVSWLPPFHDMGLVGAIAYPLFAGAGCVQFPPAAFMRRPHRWLRALSDHRATLTVAPNFAYALMAERADDPLLRAIRLDSVRVAVNGAERIRPDTLRRFADAYVDRGFAPNALTPAYGLAEATLLVAARLRAPGEPLRTIVLDRRELARGRAIVAAGDDGIELASVGTPAGVHVLIADPLSGLASQDACIGEILVRGPSVAAGYWGQSAGTRESFTERDGETWLRTGDLGFVHEGELYVAGRSKELLILGGRNLYPQDIEQTVATVEPAFSADGCAVFALEDEDSGALAIVQEISGASALDSVDLAARIRAALAEAHDLYDLARVVLVRAGHLPRTSSGKVQRGRCRDLLREGAFSAVWEWRVEQASDAPADPDSLAEDAVTERVAGIVADVLGAVPEDRHQDLFAFGLDSIQASMLIARLREAFGVDCTPADLFASPTLAGLARIVQLAQRSNGDALPLADRSLPLPLSWSQQRLWFLDRLDAAAGAAYHIAAGVRLRGALDEAALTRALDRIAERHESLRTVFEHGVDGPVQVVRAATGLALERQDLQAISAPQREAALAQACREYASAPFDLSMHPPVRALLLRLQTDEHVLVLVQHHIVSDGWSQGVLVRELGALYAAYAQGRPDPLPALPLQYADYAAWQRARLSQADSADQVQAWCEQLRGAPELLALPTDQPRPSLQSYRGGLLSVRLDAGLTRRLHGLARAHGTTLYTVLLAGWSALLSRLSGQDEVVVGSPVANRPRVQLEGLIGFFVNTLALRTRVEGATTVAELLAQVRAASMAAYEHQEVPFERVVEALHPQRSLSHSPVFQTLLSLDNTPERTLALPGLKVEAYAVSHGATQFDLSLTLREEGQELSGAIEYASDLFDADTIARWSRWLERLLDGMAQSPDATVSSLALLDEDERSQLLQASAGPSTEQSPQTLVELFESQVARTPDAVALRSGEAQLSYAQLEAASNRVAHALIELGVVPDTCVGLCAERGIELVVGLLGILKAGGAYVPLDPGYPRERVLQMLEDAAPVAVVSAGGAAARLGVDAVAVLEVQDTADSARSHAPNVALRSDHLAYVIYTSGSTGRPKGVAIEHRNTVNLLAWAHSAFAPEELACTVCSTSVNFDLAVFELLVPLTQGGSVVLVEDLLRAGAQLEGATLVNTVPSVLKAVLDAGGLPPSVRAVNLAGEPLKRELVEQVFAQTQAVRVANLYGPTETTTYSTWVSMPRSTGFVPGIGAPIANTRAYVVDEHGELVAPGVVGELWLGGAGVARGYLHRPELTAERFIDDPFVLGGRVYRTGDLVRRRGDGGLDYLGRNDFQVKLRGYRIELGEIEAALQACPGVRDAVVVARGDAGSERTLVAYWQGDAIEVSALRSQLQSRLPEYMLPSAFVHVDHWPLTPNGKLDRAALPAPEGDAHARQAYEAPEGEVEQALSQLWTELLGVERVGRHDHFFALGGHSLLAVRLQARVHERLGVELPLREVFAEPTLAGQARRVQAGAGSGLPAIAPASREDRLPLSWSQQRLWFLDRLDAAAGAAYHVAAGLRLHGALDESALERALARIVERHEALRTRFEDVEGEPEQRIEAAVGFALRRVDLSALPMQSRETALEAQMREEAQSRFDLSRGPLIRGRLLRLEAEEHVLLVTQHHIVSDGWSLGVLVEELRALYAAFAQGLDDPLPPLPVQYADYALWQRGWLSGARWEAQSRYWREQLRGAPELLALPTDRPRPPVQSYAGRMHAVRLDAALTKRLRALAQTHGATLYMVLLAGWSALLSRLSGQGEVVVGTAVANRRDSRLDGLIGFFVNTLALRLELPRDSTTAQWLDSVKQVALDGFVHQDVPFAQVVESMAPERSLGHNPLVQAMFVLQNAPRGGDPSLHELRVERIAIPHTTTQFDISLSLSETQDGLSGAIEYASDLFDADTVARWSRWLERLLDGMARSPNAAVASLALLDEDEHAQLLQGSAGPSAEQTQQTLVELFQAQVARTPDAAALRSGAARLSYAQLDAASNRVAHALIDLGVVPDTRVGLCAERGIELVVGLLGILKAGGAYVPLDPGYPRERVLQMLEDAAPVAVVSAGGAAARLGLDGVAVLDVEATADSAQSHAPQVALRPDHLAYVIYTSGSTGRPKGVMVEHRQLLHLWQGMRERVFDELPPALCVALNASVSFDASLQALVQLGSGHTVCIVPANVRADADRMLDFLDTEAVSVFDCTPSQLDLLIHGGLFERPLPRLRAILVGGEAFPAAAWKRAAAAPVACYNAYGPTECTVNSTLARVSAEHGPHLGEPLPGVQAYVVEADGTLAAPGVVGELWLGGNGVARGYLHRPELTAERFIDNPFGEGRLYRSGDLVRRRADGRLDYLGRNDDQVKIRGHRIELGEIQACLREAEGVRDALVTVVRDRDGEPRIAAYVVPDPAAADARAADAQVEQWSGIFDEQADEDGGDGSDRFDTVGWNSSYTRDAIADEAMREWLDTTLARIRELRPRRVLEVGCGTGLLLQNLAADCSRYVGTDLSARTVGKLARRIARDPAIAAVARVGAAPAHDLSAVEERFDTAILNSVAQYFPDADYLQRTLEAMLSRLEPSGRLFVGDIRHWGLGEAFHLSVALHQAAAGARDAQVLEQARRRAIADRELLVDPAWFLSLRSRYPQIRDIEILPKLGERHTEMAAFRYDVVIHTHASSSHDDASADATPPLDWRDWRGTAALTEMLDAAAADPSSIVAVRGIAHPWIAPFARMLEQRRVMPGFLPYRPQAESDDDSLGMLPARLAAMCAQRGLALRLSWADSGRDGRYDAAIGAQAKLQALTGAAFPSSPLPSSGLHSWPLLAAACADLPLRLRAALARQLPDYMLPSAFVPMVRWPLTAGGKLDRAALPPPDEDALARRAFVEPADGAEATLAVLWRDLLGIERIGRHDHFFEIGGHSLMAVRLVARIEEALGVQLPLREVFEHPTLAAMAAQAGQARAGGLPAVSPVARDRDLPLSWAQQRLWFVDRMDPEGAAAYRMPGWFRLEGELDIAALGRALDALVARHETLRTRFPANDGIARQHILPAESGFALRRIDLSHLPEDEAWAQARTACLDEVRRGFDLAADTPIRGLLARIGERSHGLLVLQHHIASDGWSVAILTRELSALYAAFAAGRPDPLPPLPVQYADYAVWQRETMPAHSHEDHLAFWRTHLQGAPERLDLPTDRPRPASPSTRGGEVIRCLDARLADAVRGFGAARGMTLFMTALTAWSALMARLSGQDDIVVGTPIANRVRAELEPLIGFFINSLPLRLRLSAEETFEGLARQARATALDAYRHQDLPFEQIVEAVRPERGEASHAPLFQTMLLCQNMPRGELALPGIEATALVPLEIGAKCDLTVYVSDDDGRIELRYEYAADLFDPASIERCADHFEALLLTMTQAPETAIVSAPLAARARADKAVATQAEQTDVDARALSPHQQRLWFIETFEAGSLYPSSPTYHNLPLLMWLSGRVDADRLRAAVARVVSAQPALRTRIVAEDGRVEQRFVDDDRIPWSQVDTDTDPVHAALAWAAEPMPLGEGALLRSRLYRDGAQRSLLALSVHHIVADRAALMQIANAIVQAYDGEPIATIQTNEYLARLHRDSQAQLTFEPAALYWRRQLRAPLQAVELPLNRPRPTVHTYTAARIDFRIDAAVAAAVRATAARISGDEAAVANAAFAALIRRYAGHEDIVFGTSAAAEPAALGPFANLRVIRQRIGTDTRVAALLAESARVRAQADAHAQVPFDRLVQWLAPEKNMSRTALFDLLFQFERAPTVRQGADFVVRTVETNLGYGKNDLHLLVSDEGDGYACHLVYNADFFDAWMADQIAGHYAALLHEVTGDDSRTVDALPLLSAAEVERQRELAQGARADYPHTQTLHGLIGRQAEQAPDRVALIDGRGGLTYSVLEARANRLARLLRARGAAPGDRIGLLASRSVEAGVAILAILKAGCAYVPLDPDAPAERIAFALDDAGARLAVIAGDANAQGLPAHCEAVASDDPGLAELSDAAIGEDVQADADAYVIYTSGSTGQPKGVPITHRNVVRLLINDALPFRFDTDDVWSVFHSFAFDFSVWELFGALLHGACAAIVPGALRTDPRGFAQWLAANRVSVLSQTPSAFQALSRMLPDAIDFSALRYVVFGGESLNPSKLAPFHRRHPRVALVNMYGITETCVHVTFKYLGATELASADNNVGRPIPTTRVYILSRDRRMLPYGATGEIYVGGLGLSRGYLNRDALTAERFVADPFGPGQVLYRSGDLGRFLENGDIQHLGRIDQQVQLRGFRIEPGEIEAALLRLPAVAQAAVIARADRSGDLRLIAYIVPAGSAQLDLSSLDVPGLRAALCASLAEYMVPSAFVPMAALPLTRNGKLDTDRLPAPDRDAVGALAYQAPQGEVESVIAEVWTQLFDLPRVGRHDHFFRLGGHSLMVVTLIERLAQRGLRLDVRSVFSAPVLCDLAALATEPAATFAQAGESSLPRLTDADVRDALIKARGGVDDLEDAYPLSPLQQGMLFHHLRDEGPDAYLIRTLLQFERGEDMAAFVAGLQSMVDRHDILRTSVHWQGLREPLQLVHRGARLPVEAVTPPPGTTATQALMQASDPSRVRLDLTRPPLLRVWTAFDEASGTWLLAILNHHIVSDHVSLELVLAQVAAQMRADRADVVPAAPYREFIESVAASSEAAHAAYFSALLATVDEITAPFGVATVADGVIGASNGTRRVEAALAARLRDCAREAGVSAAAVFHLAWALALGAASGRSDVVFGTVLSGRLHNASLAATPGVFINTLPMRVDLDAASALAALRALHEQLGALLEHEHASLALAQRCSGLGAGAAPFAALINYRHSAGLLAGIEDAGEGGEVDGAFGMRLLVSDEHTHYPLALSVDDYGAGFALKVHCAKGIESEAALERIEHAVRVLVGALEAETSGATAMAPSALPTLSASERKRLTADWNATDHAYPCEVMHAGFERQVLERPQALAVLCGDERWSYQALNERANRIAHRLLADGVQAGDRVGILLERGPWMVAAVLAVAKAGAAYVPLDPAHPVQRLRETLEDCAPRRVLSQRSLSQHEGLSSVAVLCVDEAERWSDQPVWNPSSQGIGVDAQALAYVIYTSGSTGRPKGVMVKHAAAANLFAWVESTFAMGPSDRVLFTTSLSFDLSVYDLFGVLWSGGSVHVARSEDVRDPARLIELLRSGITFWDSAPAVFAGLVGSLTEEVSRDLRLAFFSGDWIGLELPDAVRRAFPRCEVVALGGATEATVWSNYHRIDRVEPHWKSIPYGRPIWNARYYVLDARGEPSPVGVPGDLYIAGDCLAEGYWNRDELTAERFVPDPFVSGERMYKTGDRARYWADGTMEFLGRSDFQVKIRGYRIELGEIESALQACAGVRDAVVVARGEAGSERILVAYWQGDAIEVSTLRSQLQSRLPEYMLPSAYVHVDQWPLTPNGKLDRAALPAPEGDAHARQAYEAPEGEVEQALSQVWTELLGVERVGRHDHFFALGGHSLLAVRLQARVHERLGVELPLREVFAEPTLAGQARRVQAGAGSGLPAIAPASREDRLPLSWSQQRLWFLDRLDAAAGAAYHVAAGLRLHGALDESALERALARIVERHEALRTRFEDVEGEPEQRIEPAAGFALRRVDLSTLPTQSRETALEAQMREEAQSRFDLSRGPLIRGRLLRLDSDEHVLLVTQHHIVSDGWSLGVLVEELRALYAAFAQSLDDPLPPLPVQYADYALWQRGWLSGARWEAQSRYWREQLRGAPELLALPTDRPRPPVQSYAGRMHAVRLDAALTKRLRALAQTHGATLYMVLLAGWSALLSRLSGQGEVVIGSPVANRPRVELEGLIGFFVNTLALRTRVENSTTVAALLADIRETTLAAHEHQDLPFDRVVDAVQPSRTLGHAPIFQTLLVLDNTTDKPAAALPGMRVEALSIPHATTQFDISLSLTETQDGLSGAIEYASDLFDADTVARWSQWLERLLDGMAQSPDATVSSLALLDEDERSQLLQASAGSSTEQSPQTLVDLFESQVARTPDTVALRSGEAQLSYAQLEAASNRVAHALIELGVVPDTCVGLCAERGIELVVGLLGILKAGGAYVPLDPGYPRERVLQMLEDAAPVAVVSAGGAAARLGVDAVAVLEVQDTADSARSHAPNVALRSDHLAYVIYTSGSTGRPKGVAIEHRNTVNLLAWAHSAFAPEELACTVCSTSVNFDLAVFELLVPLTQGGSVVLVEDLLRAGAQLEGATLVNTVPSVLKAVLDAGGLPPSVRAVNLAGEPLKRELVEQVFAQTQAVRVANLYGPTETTTYSTWVSMPRSTGFVPGIGAPIANTRAYVVDEHGELVAPGVVGELWLGGAGVARGYLHRPELTAERFIDDPFVLGGRVYRTGDLVRRRGDGGLDYLGRNDFQVKLRGYRIELGEIEAALQACPGVRDAVVVARGDAGSERTLVAYWQGDAIEVSALRSQLQSRLPEYMLPSAFVHVDHWPLTPNGKLDRVALPAPESDAHARQVYEAPEGEVEQALSQLWTELLGVERIGRHDHFFALGGHSLLVVRLQAMIERRLQHRLTMVELFTHTTVAQLAAFIRDGDREAGRLTDGDRRGEQRREALRRRRGRRASAEHEIELED
ncbi:non-ribosomal peptide synthase/polyketide synthase [Lysobacter capsici]|uniref:non-ribosomal peptide synthase/polyketide synthase n=9 Tax=Lysobacter capsici TaxID=435897 RepID=UPI00287B8FC8|nr:non-ribosomal peptide synthase/polyketide synthase [Lysobacter capsici]WND83244.1 non-ribosomal peptide synthase/polyketide synthase [Lysobacter capsici]WND88442.1 non-ribosomal peptide synthase/polyketide synthase [Lysobacter capsici]